MTPASIASSAARSGCICDQPLGGGDAVLLGTLLVADLVGKGLPQTLPCPPRSDRPGPSARPGVASASCPFGLRRGIRATRSFWSELLRAGPSLPLGPAGRQTGEERFGVGRLVRPEEPAQERREGACHIARAACSATIRTADRNAVGGLRLAPGRGRGNRRAWRAAALVAARGIQGSLPFSGTREHPRRSRRQHAAEAGISAGASKAARRTGRTLEKPVIEQALLEDHPGPSHRCAAAPRPPLRGARRRRSPGPFQSRGCRLIASPRRRRGRCKAQSA